MPGFETIEVLDKIVNEDGRIPVEVSIDLQCRIKDDETKTRPFVKLKLCVGNRVIFCDVDQAKALSESIDELIPKAEAKVSQLKAEKQAAWEAKQAARNNRGKRGGTGTRSPGVTQREREKIARGDKKSSAQRKAEKSARDKELRNKMKAGSGQKGK